MQWITENWLLILLFGGMAAMHLFGHGHGHGKGKGKQHGHSEQDEKTDAPAADNKPAGREAQNPDRE